MKWWGVAPNGALTTPNPARVRPVSDAVATIAAIGTTVAASAALATSVVALRIQRTVAGAEGRHAAAADLARWAVNAADVIERIHNPENWRVPEGVVYGPSTGIKPGDIVPPSQGRIGPVISREVSKLASAQELSRLSFGDSHEVTEAVRAVGESIQQIADRGVIYAEEDGQTPREYVLEVFWPRVVHLYEALAASVDLRASQPRPPSQTTSTGTNG